MSHVRTYNPSVRVGNWSEDLQLEEDVLKDFLDRRDKGELLTQKLSNLAGSVLSESQLSVSRDGSVHFGDVIMLVNPAARDQAKYSASADPRQESVLSANPGSSDIMESKTIRDCSTSGSMCMKPCARNVFRIESVDGTPRGEPLRFGQQFQLACASDLAAGLCLFSDNLTFNQATKKARKQVVNLTSDCASYQTRFKAAPLNPQIRFEYEGAPVPANERVVVFHCKTGQALAVESTSIFKSMFGKEYELSCTTYLDSHKAEMEQNHWAFRCHVPGSDIAPPPAQ